jgi:hypothetical protein
MRKVALALALVAVEITAACGSRATPPPDSASADVVLDAYLAALVAGDCDAGRTLATSTFTKGNGDLCGAVHVSAYTPPIGPAGTAEELVFSTTLTTSGDDVSVPSGENIWFYALKRQPSGAWRLTGGGSGP